MKNFSFQKFAPYIVGFVIFLLVTIIYFNPLLSGKKIHQADIVSYKGASKEIADYRDKNDKEALWTNSMFGGMPAYQISMRYPNNFLSPIDKILQFGLPRPAGIVFLYFLGFFILLLVLRVNPWLSIVGALAFGFSSYFFIILEAGHNTKAHAIAYMAPILVGIILAYRGKYLWGALFTALFLGLQIKANHPQITYYLLIIVLIYGLFELINAIKEKTYQHFLKATGVLLIAVIFAILPNITSLWTTYEYSKETIRGKTELSTDSDNRTSGLDKDYATHWSYGKAESFSLMIPNIKGGGSGYLKDNKKALKNLNRDVKQWVANQNHYWGNQPGTSGPVYVGAIIVFLFVLGGFIIKGRFKWVLLVATLLSLLLSWGKNFMPLTDFFLEYFPLYNKFRAVSMILVIAEFCIPILAILALNEIIKNPEVLKKKVNLFFANINATYVAFGLTGGLSILFYLSPTTFFSFFSYMEQAQFSQLKAGPNASQYSMVIDGLESARISIFKADTLRSIAFILLAALMIYLYQLKKIKSNLLIIGLGVLIVFDLIPICYRYLNNDNYVRKSKMDRPFNLSKADKAILQDKSLDYRVYNFSTNTFNESATSYFHKTIGGYHGAKFRRYQELIDNHISKEIEVLIGVLTKSPTLESINKTFENLPVLNMLNAKYFILNPSNIPLKNDFALGNVWFVKEIKIVGNADEEIAVLKGFNPRQTAVIDTRFSELLKTNISVDSTAIISLDKYEPNHLTYSSSSKTDQLAVFSEIYYAKGWNAYIDGKKVSHLRANYVLRALPIPLGEHIIEFKFEPQSYFIGRKISLVSSLLMLVLLLGFGGLEIKRALITLNPQGRSIKT
jgi:hypothetical protein